MYWFREKWSTSLILEKSSRGGSDKINTLGG
jgi:hypothetical protein